MQRHQCILGRQYLAESTIAAQTFDFLGNGLAHETPLLSICAAVFRCLSHLRIVASKFGFNFHVGCFSCDRQTDFLLNIVLCARNRKRNQLKMNLRNEVLHAIDFNVIQCFIVKLHHWSYPAGWHCAYTHLRLHHSDRFDAVSCICHCAIATILIESTVSSMCVV